MSTARRGLAERRGYWGRFQQAVIPLEMANGDGATSTSLLRGHYNANRGRRRLFQSEHRCFS